MPLLFPLFVQRDLRRTHSACQQQPHPKRPSAAVTGLSLGLNLFNALTIGVLGVPGLGLLLLVKWVLI